MKYLKRYNEELEPNTYRKAGERLKRMGHAKRGDKLISWGEDVKKKEEDRNTLKRRESASKLGLYKMKILQKKATQKNISGMIISSSSEDIRLEGNFFIHFYIDESNFKESYDMWQNGESFSIPFDFGIIPADEETEDKLLKLVGEDELYLNTFYVNYMHIQLSEGNYGCDTYSYIDDNGDEVVDCDKITLNPKGELTFSNFNASGLTAYFGDRKSAVQFKKMIIDLFEGRIVYGETNDNPGGIKEFIMDELCSERDRTLDEFESIISSLRKININKLYKD